MTDVTPEGLDALARCVERDARRRVYADPPSVILDTIKARATLAAMREIMAEREELRAINADVVAERERALATAQARWDESSRLVFECGGAPLRSPRPGDPDAE